MHVRRALRQRSTSEQRRVIVAKPRPRIAVTLPAATIATLDKLSRLQKRPKSAIAADLLEEMTPALVRIASLLEAAIASRSRLPADTAAKLTEIEALLGATASAGLDRIEQAIKPAGRARRARGSRGGRRDH